MKKNVEKQIVGGKQYKNIVTVKASTKKEKRILEMYKYDAIVSGRWTSWIDTSMLPDDDKVNMYLYPECVFHGCFDYSDQSIIPDNLTVLNAYYTVRNPVRAAKWRKRHGVKVTRYTEGNEVWGYTVFHVPSFK